MTVIVSPVSLSSSLQVSHAFICSRRRLCSLIRLRSSRRPSTFPSTFSKRWSCPSILHVNKGVAVVMHLIVLLELTSSTPVSSSLPSASPVVSAKIDCLIDSKKGYSNPANVYQCARSQRCCFEYAKPSCCGSKPSTLIL